MSQLPVALNSSVKSDTIFCRDTSCLPRLAEQRIATLGVFDGLHLGHQSVFAQMRERQAELLAQGHKSSLLVVSFYPHPDLVLKKAATVPQLLTLHQKAHLLKAHGIDVLYYVHFTKSLAAMRAADFMQRFLLEQLQINNLVLGPDAHVGYKREGSPAYMLDFFKARGLWARVTEEVLHSDTVISSQTIRASIAAGDLATTESLLGRRYALRGRVVHGEGRGRSIGVPTANLHCGSQLLPGNGVYATLAKVGPRHFFSVTNIGTRPTFNGRGISVESHLLDQDVDYYDKHIEIEFVAKLRAEQRFGSPDELKAQIARDIEAAKIVLKDAVV